MTIRTVIIDDSATMRALVKKRLLAMPGVEIVGEAVDVASGRKMIRALNPDLITLDVEMPGMDGLEFLQKIMELRPSPVIIISGAQTLGEAISRRALELGAIGFVSKSELLDLAGENRSNPLAGLVELATDPNYSIKIGTKPPPVALRTTQVNPRSKLIAIGSSSGGVEALHTVLASFTKDCAPTLIVQHIDAKFAESTAESLNKVCPAHVRLAENGAVLKPGNIYFAPGGNRHLILRHAGKQHMTIKLDNGPLVSGHCPSVDVLFHSVAERVGRAATGILLTGMGQDGAAGLLALSNKGARTIVQDEASSTVFGMPQRAISLGAAQIVSPLARIASHMHGAMTGRSTSEVLGKEGTSCDQ